MKKQTQAMKIWNIAILGKVSKGAFWKVDGLGSQKYYDVLNIKAMKQAASFKELEMIIFCLLGQRNSEWPGLQAANSARYSGAFCFAWQMALLCGPFKYMMKVIAVNLSSSSSNNCTLKKNFLPLMSLVTDILVCLDSFIFMPYTLRSL